MKIDVIDTRTNIRGNHSWHVTTELQSIKAVLILMLHTKRIPKTTPLSDPGLHDECPSE